jgi:hypothetical protein
MLEHFLHTHSTAHTALHQQVKTCATSLNDDKFAHPDMFGVFGGQFCDMSAQKSAILTWLILFNYQYGGNLLKPQPTTTQHNTPQPT